MVLLGGERRAWASHVNDLIAAGRPDAVAEPTGLGGSMIYTAGTTGKPKGALRRSIDPRAIVSRVGVLNCVAPTDVHLVAGPLYHSAPGGFALYAHLFGQTVVVMRKFDPEDALRLIARHRCTTTFMAPTLLKRIVDLPAEVRARHDVSSMRSIVVAGAPCPMRVKEEVLAYFGPVLYEFYGSTELGIDTVLLPGDMLRKPHSCGRAAPDIDLAILDDEGRPVPDRAAGRAPRAPVPRRVRRVLQEAGGHARDGARRLAERGRRGLDGRRGLRLHLRPQARHDHLGRRQHLPGRDRGRPPPSPRPCEDVAVFGVPDPEWGERVHAAIQPRSGAALTAEAVIAFCRAHIADYKTPRQVSFHDEFPRDTAGKLVKRLLREPYWAGQTTRV